MQVEARHSMPMTAPGRWGVLWVIPWIDGRSALYWLLTVGTIVLSDLIGLSIAKLSAIAVAQRAGYAEVEWLRTGGMIPLIACAAYWAAGLYPGAGLGPVEELRRVTITNSIIHIAWGFLSVSVGAEWAGVVLLPSWLISCITVLLFRRLTRKVGAKVRWWGVPVAICGDGKLADSISNMLGSRLDIGYRPILVITNEGIKSIDGADIARRCLSGGDAGHLTQGTGNKRSSKLSHLSEIWADFLHGVRPEFLESYQRVNGIPRWTINLGDSGVLVCEVTSGLDDLVKAWIKRLIDIFGAVLLIIVTSPLFVVLPGLIWLESPGPIIFRQQRVGKGGRLFTALKFRTMVVDAEERLAELLEKDVAARREYELFRKLRNDPRVTRVGRILRRFSLDELPQLWNVLRGEMSLVGPRAYLPQEVDLIGDDTKRVIFSVAPGLTGIWQVSGRNNLSFEERVWLEELYVRQWSLWLDIYILARTVGVVLSGRGAY